MQRAVRATPHAPNIQPPLLRFPPDGHVDQRTVVGSKSGERRRVMGADQDVDAVDLVQGEPVDRPQPSCGGHHFRTRAAETGLQGVRRAPARESFSAFVTCSRSSAFSRPRPLRPQAASTARDLSLEQRPDFRRRRPGHNQYAAQARWRWDVRRAGGRPPTQRTRLRGRG